MLQGRNNETLDDLYTNEQCQVRECSIGKAVIGDALWVLERQLRKRDGYSMERGPIMQCYRETLVWVTSKYSARNALRRRHVHFRNNELEGPEQLCRIYVYNSGIIH